MKIKHAHKITRAGMEESVRAQGATCIARVWETGAALSVTAVCILISSHMMCIE